MPEPREVILKAAEDLALKGKRATTANISDATQLKTQVISAHIRRLREKGQWRFNGLGEPVAVKSQSPYVKRMIEIEKSMSKEETEAPSKRYVIMEDEQEDNPDNDINELEFISRTLNDLGFMSESARIRVWRYLTDRVREGHPELNFESSFNPDKA